MCPPYLSMYVCMYICTSPSEEEEKGKKKERKRKKKREKKSKCCPPLPAHEAAPLPVLVEARSRYLSRYIVWYEHGRN